MSHSLTFKRYSLPSIKYIAVHFVWENDRWQLHQQGNQQETDTNEENITSFERIFSCKRICSETIMSQAWEACSTWIIESCIILFSWLKENTQGINKRKNNWRKYKQIWLNLDEGVALVRDWHLKETVPLQEESQSKHNEENITQRKTYESRS